MRIGHGYDAHRFAEGKKLRIGGVSIESDKGLLAHSDGDVLLHALTDAILGAAGERDIGYFFPPTDDKYKDIDSRILLGKTVDIIHSKGLRIEYADMTIIAQTPKMSPYIDEMRTVIAETLCVSADRVNVKATTEEHMGFTGRKEGIAAHAVCILREAFD